MNRITITGRLTRDPELGSLPSGDPVCKLRLAVDGMAPKRETGYVDVSAFGPSGEAAARVLTKGYLVAVDGRLEYSTWEKDGQTRHSYQVIGHVEFLAAPKGDGTSAESAESADSETADEPVAA
ncbi:MAG TPA: single-stranded DNA-binding protein [Gaiellales bacterium]|nr:single-stranded DNA-binding protein [Gaiellales bacterium]